MSNATRKMVHRLLDQYRGSHHFRGLLEAVGKRFDDTDEIIFHFLFGRYLETAAGVELDRVGELLDFARPAGYREDGIFRFRSFTDPAAPSDCGYNAGVYQSADGLETGARIDDDEYRELLRWRAESKNTGASLPEIWAWARAVAGVDVEILEPAPGAITIRVLGTSTRRAKWILKNANPAAAGVSVSVI